jgi:hypothetical protein
MSFYEDSGRGGGTFLQISLAHQGSCIHLRRLGRTVGVVAVHVLATQHRVVPEDKVRLCTMKRSGVGSALRANQKNSPCSASRSLSFGSPSYFIAKSIVREAVATAAAAAAAVGATQTVREPSCGSTKQWVRQAVGDQAVGGSSMGVKDQAVGGSSSG